MAQGTVCGTHADGEWVDRSTHAHRTCHRGRVLITLPLYMRCTSSECAFGTSDGLYMALLSTAGPLRCQHQAPGKHIRRGRRVDPIPPTPLCGGGSCAHHQKQSNVYNCCRGALCCCALACSLMVRVAGCKGRGGGQRSFILTKWARARPQSRRGIGHFGQGPLGQASGQFLPFQGKGYAESAGIPVFSWTCTSPGDSPAPPYRPTVGRTPDGPCHSRVLFTYHTVCKCR